MSSAPDDMKKGSFTNGGERERCEFMGELIFYSPNNNETILYESTYFKILTFNRKNRTFYVYEDKVRVFDWRIPQDLKPLKTIEIVDKDIYSSVDGFSFSIVGITNGDKNGKNLHLIYCTMILYTEPMKRITIHF